MRSMWRGLAMIGALAAATGATRAQAPAEKTVTNEHRLFQRFIEDGAVTENVWFEGQFRYQFYEDAEAAYVEPTLAVNVAEDIEVGGRIRLLTVNPDDSDIETGFSDMDIYGKLRLSTKPTQLSLGLLLKLPTGDEKKSLLHGTGEADVAFFGGLRHDFKEMSLVANAGFRMNQDPDTPAQLDGEISVQLGGAALFPLTQKFVGIVEATYETERIDGIGSDFRLTLGGDYGFGESFKARFGVGLGNGGSAPDYELIGSAVFLF